jgi:hypothetical protein
MMGERRTYYDRRLQAKLTPSLILSTIADGMQQNHCTLPWLGNTKTPNEHIKQHLQGILMHGSGVNVYRTFANVGGGANLAIHTWLLSLEEEMERRKAAGVPWPRTYYHQIDGGPENANDAMLAICVLLIHRGVFDKIILTRLPVGHTHEDIDGLFALIWKKLRDEYIITPSQFSDLIAYSLRKKARVVVNDVHAVPDYVKLLDGCIDKDLGRYAKEEWAQLQMHFDRNDNAHMDCDISYQAYTQDEFIEVVQEVVPEGKEARSLSGLVPQLCRVRRHPLPGDEPLVILHKLPTADIAPAPFVAGSRALTVQVAESIMSKYKTSKPKIYDEWKNWRDVISPQSDDAQDHCAANPLHVPFKDILFGDCGFSEYEVNPRNRLARGGSGMRTVVTTSCIVHSGAKKPSQKAREIPCRAVVQEADGTLVTGMVGALPLPLTGRAERRQMQLDKNKKKRDDKVVEAGKASAAAAVRVGHTHKNVDGGGSGNTKKKKRSALREDSGSSDENDNDGKSNRVDDDGDSNREDDDDVSSSDEEDDCSDSDVDQEQFYDVGERVANIHNLHCDILSFSRGKYTVQYLCDGTEEEIGFSSLKPILKKPIAPRRNAVTYEMKVVAADEEWVDTGKVDQTSILTAKRSRSNVTYGK